MIQNPCSRKKLHVYPYLVNLFDGYSVELLSTKSFFKLDHLLAMAPAGLREFLASYYHVNIPV